MRLSIITVLLFDRVMLNEHCPAACACTSLDLGSASLTNQLLMALIKPLSRCIEQPHMTHTQRCSIRSVRHQDHIEQSLFCGSCRRALTFGVVGPFAASTTYWQLSLLAFSEVMTLPMAAGTSTSHASYSTESLSIASPTKHQFDYNALGLIQHESEWGNVHEPGNVQQLKWLIMNEISQENCLLASERTR